MLRPEPSWQSVIYDTTVICEGSQRILSAQQLGGSVIQRSIVRASSPGEKAVNHPNPAT